METKKHHTVRTVPKSNRKIVERDKFDTPKTQIHDRSLSWFGMKYKITRNILYKNYNNDKSISSTEMEKK